MEALFASATVASLALEVNQLQDELARPLPSASAPRWHASGAVLRPGAHVVPAPAPPAGAALQHAPGGGAPRPHRRGGPGDGPPAAPRAAHVPALHVPHQGRAPPARLPRGALVGAVRGGAGRGRGHALPRACARWACAPSTWSASPSTASSSSASPRTATSCCSSCTTCSPTARPTTSSCVSSARSTPRRSASRLPRSRRSGSRPRISPRGSAPPSPRAREAEQLEYWKHQLASAPEVLRLPTDMVPSRRSIAAPRRAGCSSPTR